MFQRIENLFTFYFEPSINVLALYRGTKVFIRTLIMAVLQKKDGIVYLETLKRALFIIKFLT